MAEQATIGRRVAAVVSEVLGDPPDRIETVAADSLARAELILALEETFGVRLPDDAAFASMAEVAEAVRAVSVGLSVSPGHLGNGFGRLQWVVDAVLEVPIRRAYRLRVTGASNVPASGPAVLASNHDSLLDIPCLVVASPRPVWFMAKVELFRSALASRFIHALGGFPVRRGGRDLRAVRAALEVIRRGRVLGMYPEGTRAPHLQEFLPGAAWVALATGAPLIPVGVSGTAEAMPRGAALPRRTNVSLRFGERMRVGREVDPRARLERARKVTQELRSEIERLID
ncbi:MAG: 1-acyl-sn-glycerol-3-phosphate acyltransferase [Actinomycetota bacterium]